MIQTYKDRIQAQRLRGEFDLKKELVHVRAQKRATTCPTLREFYWQVLSFLRKLDTRFVEYKGMKIGLN